MVRFYFRLSHLVNAPVVGKTSSNAWLLAAFLLLPAACSDEVNSEDAASTAEPATATTASGGTGSSSSECSLQLDCTPDCTEWDCGDVDSSFDSAGCPRDFCLSDADCNLDQRCLLEVAQGVQGGAAPVCVTPVSSCFEDDGRCICGGSLICSGYCVPR